MKPREASVSAAEPLPRESYYGFDHGETCDRAGAERIARKIEEFWRDRGKIVNTRIVPKGFHSAIRSTRYEVHSDLVDGLPSPDAVKIATGPVLVGSDDEWPSPI